MSIHNWLLEPISYGAKLRKKRFNLKEGENTVGKTKSNSIFIPSRLCSRAHCKIRLSQDQVFLIDTSTNGTYINHANNEMRHYVGNTDETGLLHNDIISFGFNICQVYDPTERQIFIYRLVKEPIVVISLDSDDENANDAPQPIITIEIDSDSDTNDSGEEFLENLDDITSSSYISSHSSTSSIPYDSNCDDNASEGSDTFVITQTIINSIPTGDNTSNGDHNNTSNGGNNRVNETSSTGHEGSIGEDAKIMSKVEKVKRLLAEKPMRRTIVTAAAPQAIRRRRGTITEAEFLKCKLGVNKNDRVVAGFHKGKNINDVNKNDRAERLREIEERKRAQRETNGEFSNEPPRKTFIPKVKNTTVSRASLLSSDMLLSDPK